MTKKIVLCFDGTWNDPSSNTNVLKVYRSILGEDMSRDRVGVPVPSPNVPAMKWYDPGVGTKLSNILGGLITGRGLAANILEGYQFLVHHFEVGEDNSRDEIYLFGFSRGAYTARSLAGLIRNIGVIKKANAPKPKYEDNPVLINGFKIYQRRDGSADTQEAEYFRATYSVDNVEIKFLGLWDTVGALGVPSSGLDSVNRGYEFHDTTLSGRVKNAYHALAIDETRPEFTPTLWTSGPKPGQHVEQVWFAGAHSDVGGGKKPALTDIPLRWMQEKALATGLEFDPKQTVCIDKQEYFGAEVTDHFKRIGYRLWARFRKSGPHLRPIGGTHVESVHGRVIQKRDAANSGYSPKNHGLTSVTGDPAYNGEWDC